MIYVYMISPMKNESDLHKAIIKYIRLRYPQTIIIPGLGEFQTTDELRLDAWQKGYTAGQPDIILLHPTEDYHGFAIELKHPKYMDRNPSHKQMLMYARLRRLNYKVLVSHSYEEVISEIVLCMANLTSGLDYGLKTNAPA